MCMEDKIIARQSRSVARLVTLVNATDTPLVGPARDRIAFIVHTGGNNARITPPNATPVTDACFVVGSSFPPLVFDIETFGDIVTKAWSGSGFLGDINVVVIEVFLERQK